LEAAGELPASSRGDGGSGGAVLEVLVIVAGAGVVIGGLMVKGYLLHRWLLKHAPGLAAWIPRDGGALAGLAIGVALVFGWAVG
jgi:hypothetical protein